MTQVTPVPCRRDNYAYLVAGRGGECVVVDASEAAPVHAALGASGLRLAAILTTHHHPDHTGGNLELAAAFDVPVYGHAIDRARIPGLTHALTDEQRFSAAGLDFTLFHLPGHTRGAITYATDECAFTGDTLFTGGCGRLKEGSAEELFASLERLKQVLPPSTICYTGHEYTESNLAFALSLLPDAAELVARHREVRQARAEGRCTAFAPLALELRTNPFLQASEPRWAEAVGLAPGSPGVEVFRALRAKKDDY